MKGKKQKDSHNGDYRCERCWSEDDINLFPRSQFIEGDAKGFVILCEKCKGEAPSEKEEEIFDNLFLRFASPKEFIQTYNAGNEKEARKLWALEMEGKEPALENSSEDTTNEREGVGVTDEIIPFGYELVDERLTVSQKSADLVKEIYRSYLSGKTMEKIARDLTKQDESIKWSLNEIREILKNPNYAGYKFQGANVIIANHEAIIDAETFNQVQQRIVRNIRNPKYLYKPLELGD
jgi:hypothetical protein